MKRLLILLLILPLLLTGCSEKSSSSKGVNSATDTLGESSGQENTDQTNPQATSDFPKAEETESQDPEQNVFDLVGVWADQDRHEVIQIDQDGLIKTDKKEGDSEKLTEERFVAEENILSIVREDGTNTVYTFKIDGDTLTLYENDNPVKTYQRQNMSFTDAVEKYV